jgi:Tfp pilus assembly protein PilF
MRPLLLLAALVTSHLVFAQTEISKQMDSAIALHERGDYDKAIAIYDELIESYDQHYDAWQEKTLSLFAAKRYQDCIATCEMVLKKFSDNPANGRIYCNWASALDELGKPNEALRVFSQGIKKYPGEYLLHLNRGITHYKQNNNTEAANDMKSTILLNPLNASAHQFLAYSTYQQNKMAFVLSIATFLMLEPQGARAANNLELLLKVLGANVQQKDEKNINITLQAGMFNMKREGPDDFREQELAINFKAALDYDDKYKHLDAAQKLKNKLELFCDREGDRDSKGFFTPTYIPLLKQLRDDKLLETACYVMKSTSNDASVKHWLTSNHDKVEAFNKWMQTYRWK